MHLQDIRRNIFSWLSDRNSTANLSLVCQDWAKEIRDRSAMGQDRRVSALMQQLACFLNEKTCQPIIQTIRKQHVPLCKHGQQVPPTIEDAANYTWGMKISLLTALCTVSSVDRQYAEEHCQLQMPWFFEKFFDEWRICACAWRTLTNLRQLPGSYVDPSVIKNLISAGLFDLAYDLSPSPTKQQALIDQIEESLVDEPACRIRRQLASVHKPSLVQSILLAITKRWILKDNPEALAFFEQLSERNQEWTKLFFMNRLLEKNLFLEAESITPELEDPIQGQLLMAGALFRAEQNDAAEKIIAEIFSNSTMNIRLGHKYLGYIRHPEMVRFLFKIVPALFGPSSAIRELLLSNGLLEEAQTMTLDMPENLARCLGVQHIINWCIETSRIDEGFQYIADTRMLFTASPSTQNIFDAIISRFFPKLCIAKGAYAAYEMFNLLGDCRSEYTKSAAVSLALIDEVELAEDLIQLLPRGLRRSPLMELGKTYARLQNIEKISTTYKLLIEIYPDANTVDHFLCNAVDTITEKMSSEQIPFALQLLAFAQERCLATESYLFFAREIARSFAEIGCGSDACSLLSSIPNSSRETLAYDLARILASSDIANAPRAFKYIESPPLLDLAREAISKAYAERPEPDSWKPALEVAEQVSDEELKTKILAYIFSLNPKCKE